MRVPACLPGSVCSVPSTMTGGGGGSTEAATNLSSRRRRLCVVLLLLLLLLLLLCLGFSVVEAEADDDGGSFCFDMPTFSGRNVTLLGDSYLRHDGKLGLSKALQVPTTSAGRALYRQPFRFLDNTNTNTNTSSSSSSASFSTRFSFSISTSDATAGAGLAFILVTDDRSVGSAGPYMAITNASSSASASASAGIAVEFDTFLDVELHDMNDNHVGLDLKGNLTSAASADAGSLQMDLNSGDIINAWIDYNSSANTLHVRLSYADTKPAAALLNVSGIRLQDYFSTEYLFVGFSASTGGSTELHLIHDWTFSISSHFPSQSQSPSPSPSPQRYLSPAPAPAAIVGHRQLPIWVVYGTVAAGLALILCVGCCCFCLWLWFRKWKHGKLSKSFTTELEKLPQRFSYRELHRATDGFSDAKIVGHGSFGTVYRGTLPGSGLAVAVKRSTQREKEKKKKKKKKEGGRHDCEFRWELGIIGGLRHRNLVQLQGWCYHRRQLLLVYDYMPNGSLDRLLFQADDDDDSDASDAAPPRLSWGHRYSIVKGVASALAYLHSECEPQVIHRDVKASNIMLDAGLNARLGDFGLARLMESGKTPEATLTAGTMGYVAPEYLLCGTASHLTDVFSFGAVALELACGRPIISVSNVKNVSLVDWVWGLHGRGRLLEAADARLQGQFCSNDMERLLLLGLACSNPDPKQRPSMLQVLHILNGHAPPPRVPLFKPRMSFATASASASASASTSVSATASASASSSSHLSITIPDVVSENGNLSRGSMSISSSSFTD